MAQVSAIAEEVRVRREARGLHALPPRYAPRWAPPAVLFRACRPRQWLKNVIVLMAPIAAGAIVRPGVLPAVAGAFAVFCLLASATYLGNDVRDVEADRLHPRKRHRPVAAGELSPAAALRAAAGLALAGLGLAAIVRPALAVVAITYLLLTLDYSLWLRDVVVLDMLAVAAGFVLRAVAGAAAAGVTPSGSFLLVTSACALFLVAGKRFAEARGRRGPAGRPTLRRYSLLGLRRALIGSALFACLAYGGWALERPAPGPWLGLSLAPFALWLVRYAHRVGHGAGEAPEELVLSDPVLLLLAAVWAILFAVAIYGPR